MNYEQLLDEIMINTVSAEQLVWYPQKDFHYAVCPWTLEFHTTIFLSSILLSFNQEKPLAILVQVDDLPSSAMLYTWKVWPHFWRTRDFSKNIPSQLENLEQTTENHYQYLDKLFCYLSVININPNHRVIFVKKGEKNSEVADDLREILKEDYSLLVISNCYEGLPTWECKEKAENLISHLKEKSLDNEEKEEFTALDILSELLPKNENPDTIEQLVNSWEIWFDTKKTTSLRFMMS